ncbi:VOC family protein [Sphingomonas cavernae]|uniref:VOC family protein n=1 Tax=Sphingomonas cavernae TaxID=2320861 RepID=A0A418WLW5_9SPHN|nr:VOC family protein [Sphingomonas cavernae]RJF90996.1 VOC family protein [Sphingomonas cavernae]
MSKIIPSLWFADKAEEAAKFYVSLLPDSRIDSVMTMPAESPAGPEGSVVIVDFTLAGQQFQAIKAGPLDPFNHAISFTIDCEDQAEVDRLWDALLDGGTPEQCGWIRDRYGVAWQIVPNTLIEMMKDPDRDRGRRVAQAMLKMVKLDVAGLKAAYDAEPVG